MKLANYETENYVWEVFQTNPCTKEYCADGDGFVSVHEVVKAGFLVTSPWYGGVALQEFVGTLQDAQAVEDHVRQDSQGSLTTSILPVYPGDVFIFAEGMQIAKHGDLVIAMREAELYANATYPGMLSHRVRSMERKSS